LATDTQNIRKISRYRIFIRQS